MKSFRNIVYSETPPGIHDLWLRGTTDSKDPFEIRVFQNNRWEIIDKGNSVQVEDTLGDSEDATVSLKVITEQIAKLENQILGIDTTKVVIDYKPIENTGEDTYEVNLKVQKIGDLDKISDIYIIEGDKQYPVEGDSYKLTINKNSLYYYSYTVDGIIYTQPLEITVTDPLYYGFSETDNFYVEILQSEGINKIVLETFDLKISEVPIKNPLYLYIAIPSKKSVVVQSMGIDISMDKKDVKHLNTLYHLYKSFKLKQGKIKNFIIKIF